MPPAARTPPAASSTKADDLLRAVQRTLTDPAAAYTFTQDVVSAPLNASVRGVEIVALDGFRGEFVQQFPTQFAQLGFFNHRYFREVGGPWRDGTESPKALLNRLRSESVRTALSLGVDPAAITAILCEGQAATASHRRVTNVHDVVYDVRIDMQRRDGCPVAVRAQLTLLATLQGSCRDAYFAVDARGHLTAFGFRLVYRNGLGESHTTTVTQTLSRTAPRAFRMPTFASPPPS